MKKPLVSLLFMGILLSALSVSANPIKPMFEEAIRAYLKYVELAPNASDKKDIEMRIRRLGGR